MRTTSQSGTPLDPPPMPRSAFAYAEQASRPGRRFGDRAGRVKAQGFFGLGLGLLIASGILTAGLVVAAGRLRPGWRVLLRYGRVRRSLVGWFGGLGLLTVASVIMRAAA